jgi:hypothetical protein
MSPNRTLALNDRLLVLQHRRFGHRNFGIEHVWRTEWELADLKRCLDDPKVQSFLLTVPIGRESAAHPAQAGGMRD